MEYLIKQYPLDTGALEIQYIEEYFWEFPKKKTAGEIIRRLQDREFLIVMAEAPLPDDPLGAVVPLDVVAGAASSSEPAQPGSATAAAAASTAS